MAIINMFQKYELNERAYGEGRMASQINESDVNKCPNPYPENTPQNESWLLGWNSDYSFSL